MARLFILLIRLMPLEILIAVIAFFAYKALSNRRSNAIAKEVLIKIVLNSNIVIGIFCLIVTLYAVADKHAAMVELSACGAAICAVVALIAYICKRVFLKNRPGYQWKRFDFGKLIGRKKS